jgi:cell wall-associated NlpC family hydrolase
VPRVTPDITPDGAVADAAPPAAARGPAGRAGRGARGVVRLVRLMACSLAAGALAGGAWASEADDPLLSMLHARRLVADASPQHAGMRPAASAELVLAAMNFLDVQYRFGGSDAQEGFDCSGFTRHVFATALGLALPRRAEQQAQAPALRDVQRDELEPGDLVFFNTLRRAFSHVGLYIGDGRFVHAPRSGALVRVERIDTRYWATRFDGARRLGAAAPPAAARIVKADDEAIEAWASPH